MILTKAHLNGINITNLRQSCALWVHAEKQFPLYSKILKKDLIKRMIPLLHYKEEENEDTLHDCLLWLAYSQPLPSHQTPIGAAVPTPTGGLGGVASGVGTNIEGKTVANPIATAAISANGSAPP